MPRDAGAVEARVTIVVLTHNRAAELAATLRALRSLPDAAPIIVVDNASNDGTAAQVFREFPEVTLVRCARNLGAAGRNAGVAAVRTPYVAFCDDDTDWQPGALRTAANLLDAHPRLGAIVARVQLGEPLRDDPICALLAASPLPADDLPGPQLLGLLAGASVLRVDAYRAAGGFWPPLFIGGEEGLLAFDLLTQGWRIAYVEGIVTRHRPSKQREATRRGTLLLRNAIWTAWLRLPLADALAVSAGTLAEAWRARRLLAVLLATLRGLWPVARARRVVPREVVAMWRTVRRRERQWRHRAMPAPAVSPAADAAAESREASS